jgi:phage gp29-like protein
MLFQRLDGTFSQKLFQMLSACLTGFSIHEQVWDVETEGPWAGKLILSKLKHRDPSDFTFKTDQALNVISLIQKQRAAAEVSLDPKKFLLYSYLAWFSNPYGSADGRSVYRPFIIKDMAWKMRAIYTEKFAMPSLVGKYPGGQVTQAQKDAFFSAIAQYQSDTGILIPADLALEALEISTQGNTVFAETIKDLNDSICTAILLGFLQMGEGKNTGALRAGEVHERSESVFVAYLAEDVAEVFNEQVIQPLVRWNFGANVACPYLAIRTQKNKDLTLELNILEKASALGLLISEEETYERLGLRKPGPGEVVLEPRQAPTPTHPVFPFGSAVKPANYAAQPPRNQIQLLAEAAIAGGKKAGDALLAADFDVLKKKSLK